LVSKTSLRDSVRSYDWKAVDKGLSERPDLLAHRDERERNWLHILCGAPLGKRDPRAGIKTADILLARGIPLDSCAFTEGRWKSTPVWWCVAHGRNLALAEHLLKLGADPNYSLFAACWNDDLDAIDLLMKYGAPVDDPESPKETPFLGAVAWSRFRAAEALLKHGADPNAKNAKGQTAFHLMLKKSSDFEHFKMLARYGVRVDIPDRDGTTAAQIMSRKKDERFRKFAERPLAGPRAKGR
jgi:hypothetical protein